MLLKVENLSKRFNIHILGNKIINGCENVSFEVDKNEFLVISGPSGAGKSTILKCIYRTYLPTSGSIIYNSISYGKIDLSTIKDQLVLELRHKEIGYVSQFLRVIPRVSALDLVAEPLLLRNGLSLKEAQNKAGMLLERLNISTKLFDACPSTFSGGEQQRINIARAVIWEPKLLLLDEPTASLDHNSTLIVVDLLKELKEKGISIIGIFHEDKLIKPIIDKIYIIKAGDVHEK